MDESRSNLEDREDLKALIDRLQAELDAKQRVTDELREELEGEKEESFIMRKKLMANINDLKKQLKRSDQVMSSPTATVTSATAAETASTNDESNQNINQSFGSTSDEAADKQYRFDLERLVQKIIDLQDVIEQKNEMIDVLGDHLKKVKLKLFDDECSSRETTKANNDYKCEFDEEIAIRM